jgi:MHS family alpha-ketoglutarate permease-like MFS transporter
MQGRLKSIVGGSIGNLVEWYDWYVYSAFSLYFAGAFFPAGNQTVRLLNAAAVFAVGFFVRPIGGWLMGLYADRYGRRAALSVSVLLMSVGSLAIAVAPTYAAAGVLSPIVLLSARLLQGISVGGEYGASATYLSEMAGRERRGFYSSFQYVTLIMGQLLALAVLLVLQRFLTQDELQRWGWRIPFAIGAFTAIVALWIRRGLAETESFTAAASARMRASVRELLRYPRQALTVVGLTAGGTLAFYTFTAYSQKFLVNTAGWSAADATLVSALALLFFICLQPLVGHISDRIGRKPVLMFFGIFGTLLTVPLLTALAHASPKLEGWLVLSGALLIVSGYTSINAVVKAELFPTEIRALGVSLPYAIAVSLFGGTAEYIALWAKNQGHEPWFYWYVTLLIACSLVVYWLMPDTRAHSAITED